WPAASRWFARRGRVRVPGARDGRVPVERLRWAVLAVAHERPGASCLAQALTLQVLLARSGRPSVLRLGVAGGPATAFAAHAWLEHDGRILVGERRSTYASLPVPDGRSLFGG
ncbi:MAG TPA: lasso peptide biosynthesis B2 protein, partial [Vicinamibacterales bacterium]|nr:lasso peptide biosynthesis B2 protein [Vicinamibacterales bacterium]